MKMETEMSLSELVQAQSQVWHHTFNFVTSMSLKCAIQLRIPEAIHANGGGRPITLPELLAALEIRPAKAPYLHRLMRLLAHCGFFSLSHPDFSSSEIGYSLTPAGRFLVREGGAVFPLMVLDPVLMAPYHQMSTWFRSQKDDTTVMSETYGGKDTWDYFSAAPDLSKLFDAAMAADSRLVAEVVVKECNKAVFQGVDSLVDVAGGTGIMAKAIAAAFPHVHCTVLDLPHVVAGLEDHGNVNYIAGDMFQAVPPADAILLKWILHDWDEENSLKILKKCKEAILSRTDKGKTGKVMIIDMVVDDESLEVESATTQYCFDVGMLVAQKGQERNKEQWGKLFADAGFTRYHINHILGTRALIEVYP